MINSTAVTQNIRSGNRGAYLAEGDAEEHLIHDWLASQGRTADCYSDPEHFIGAVVAARYCWVVIAKAGRALTLPFFNRLFRASIETHTDFWTAADNIEFGHLFGSMMDNWEILAPYVPDSPATFSLISLRDAVSRIEARRQTTGNVAIPVKDLSISPQSNDCLIVKNGLVIDPTQFTVACRGQQCVLGNTIPFALAERLARAEGRWFSFDELRDDVWKDSQALDTTIGRTLRLLREKLNKAGVTGITIENPRKMKKHARLLIR
jgi:hypothetical protein